MNFGGALVGPWMIILFTKTLRDTVSARPYKQVKSGVRL